MFLQRQSSHESLLTLITLPGSVPVVLAGVNQHRVLRDELQVAVGAVHLALGGGEGGSLVRIDAMFVRRVMSRDVILQDVEPGEGHVAQLAGVSHPGVFLSQVPLKVLN